MNVVNLEWH